MIADDIITRLAAPLELTEAQRIALATKIRLLHPFQYFNAAWIDACRNGRLTGLDKLTLERHGITIPAP